MNNGLYAGYDVVMPDPGTEHENWCVVCGTLMDVERNVTGSTSYAAAMSGTKRTFDRFTCPHAGKNWHTNAILMMIEIKDTKSPSLRALINQDITTAVDVGLRAENTSIKPGGLDVAYVPKPSESDMDGA